MSNKTSKEIDQAVKYRPQSHDKRPVEAAGLQADVALFRKSPSLCEYEDYQKPGQCADNMEPVKANQRVEESTIHTAGKRQTKMEQLNPFIALNRKKSSTQDRCESEQANQLFPIADEHGFDGEAHRHRAGNQNQCVDPGHTYRKTRLKRRRPNRRTHTENNIGADEPGKKHRLRAEKHNNGNPSVATDGNIGPHRWGWRFTTAKCRLFRFTLGGSASSSRRAVELRAIELASQSISQ